MLPIRDLRGPLNHVRTRPAGPRARLNPHNNLCSISAPAPPRTSCTRTRPGSTQVRPASAPHPHNFVQARSDPQTDTVTN